MILTWNKTKAGWSNLAVTTLNTILTVNPISAQSSQSNKIIHSFIVALNKLVLNYEAKTGKYCSWSVSELATCTQTICSELMSNYEFCSFSCSSGTSANGPTQTETTVHVGIILTCKIWQRSEVQSMFSQGWYMPSVTQLSRITMMLILSNHVIACLGLRSKAGTLQATYLWECWVDVWTK